MPNFYSEHFPAGATAGFLWIWAIKREELRNTDPVRKEKMRAMEKYAGMVSKTADKVARETAAATIFLKEIVLPEEEQKVGNFLGSVYDQTVSFVAANPGEKPHEILESLFMHCAGYAARDSKLSGRYDPLFNSLLIQTVAHCKALGVTLSASILQYEASINMSQVNTAAGPDVEAVTKALPQLMTPMAQASASSSAILASAITFDNAVETEIGGYNAPPASKPGI